MAAKKYYAIAVGRKPGIFDNWPQALAQVHGYPGAVFKGFATRQEAEQWLRRPSYGPGRRSAADSKERNPEKQPVSRTTEVASDPTATDAIIIYTDGGARFNPGPGGYGIVRIFDGNREEMSGGFRLTTNNRMELMGCIVALRDLKPEGRPVAIHTDSSYVVNGINKGWAKSWRKNGWRKSDRTPALNADLWAELLELVEGRDITFRWVKGHAGNPLNERCDQLAVAAATRDDLPVDTGYRG